MTRHTLTGRRLVITRPLHSAQAFAEKLRELGAQPVLLPTVAIRLPHDIGPLDEALARLDRYDWVIFTSVNTVGHVWQRFDVLELNLAEIAWPQIAVIGPATAKALGKREVTPALMPYEHVAEALFEALAQTVDLRGKRVLLPQGNLARPTLADLLREAGAAVDAVTAYENVRPDVDPALLADPVDAIMFTSSSTVRNFVEMFSEPIAVMGQALVACIGPITADTARELGLPVHIMADPYTVEGLIAALCDAFERKPTR